MMRSVAVLVALGITLATGCGPSTNVPEAQMDQVQQDLGNAALVPDAAELGRMRRYLDNRYDHGKIVHQFRSGAGEDIDCVPLNEQPAMRRPEMRGHVIETPPPAPEGDVETAELEAMFGISDTPDENGNVRRCPAGSIPILRLKLEDVARFGTLENFFRKTPPGAAATAPDTEFEAPRAGSTATHQYAVSRQYVDNWGSEAVFALYNPYTEITTDFSLSQLWVIRGSGTDMQTVEGGWQRYPLKYGDQYARLFIYYTPDAYSTGCYNLDCSAFVQTNGSIVIGSKFASYSTPGGTQYVNTFRYQKGGTTGSWWFALGTTNIGYYPRSLFDSVGLADKGYRIDFGGEIVDMVTTRHTMTDMGSGRFPSEGKNYAAYQRNMKYIDTTNTYRTVTLTTSRTDAYCYDITMTSGDASWGTYILFGGPGYSDPNCL